MSKAKLDLEKAMSIVTAMEATDWHLTRLQATSMEHAKVVQLTEKEPTCDTRNISVMHVLAAAQGAENALMLPVQEGERQEPSH